MPQLLQSVRSPLARVGAFVLCAVTLLGCSKEVPPAPYQLEERTLVQLAEDLAQGRITSAVATQSYIERINRYDAPLRAIMAITSDAPEQAAASDSRRKEGKTRGVLEGIPIVLNDNIDVEGLPTTAGSFILEKNIAAHDAEVVKRLREAGAIIVGKTNLSQFSGVRAVAVLNGSTVGHAAHNPYDLARSPGSSSFGSAIAASTSFAAAAIGTDTDGTLTEPAAINGVAGMRPTLGLVSRRGVVPVAMSLDTIGAIGRSVADVAAVLSVIAGSDPTDGVTLSADAHRAELAKALDPHALKSRRFGLLRGTTGYDADTEAALEEAVKTIRAQGGEVFELPTDLLEDISPEMVTVKQCEFKEDIAAYLANAPDTQNARSLSDIIAINRFDPRENMHDQEALEAAQACRGRVDPQYQRMLEYVKRRAGPDGLALAFTKFAADAVIGLTAAPGAFLAADRTLLDRSPNVALPKGSAPPSLAGNASAAGLPHLTVPMGSVGGMPVGLSFVGPAWSDALLISFGYAFEQAAKKRTPPAAYKDGFPTR